jgi:hypothetical protein
MIRDVYTKFDREKYNIFLQLEKVNYHIERKRWKFPTLHLWNKAFKHMQQHTSPLQS